MMFWRNVKISLSVDVYVCILSVYVYVCILSVDVYVCILSVCEQYVFLVTSAVQFAGGVVVFFGLLSSPKEVGEFVYQCVCVCLGVYVCVRRCVCVCVAPLHLCVSDHDMAGLITSRGRADRVTRP